MASEAKQSSALRDAPGSRPPTAVATDVLVIDAAASGPGAGLLRVARNDGERLGQVIHLFCRVAKITCAGSPSVRPFLEF